VADAAAYDPLGAAGTWRRNRAKLVVYVLLSLFALYYLLPLGVVVLNSFRDLPDISRNGLISLPHSFSLEYWAAAWNQFCVGGTCKGVEPFFINSVGMAVPATIISTAIGSINGYVL
jgi:glucose/mannose transport system permease protein